MSSNRPETLLLLIMVHFVGDFVLQNDRMAVEKCPGKDLTLNWSWWLTGHASTHALLVYLVTSNIVICFFEFIAHFIIDWLKCKFAFRLSADQLFHLLCKIIWVCL